MSIVLPSTMVIEIQHHLSPTGTCLLLFSSPGSTHQTGWKFHEEYLSVNGKEMSLPSSSSTKLRGFLRHLDLEFHLQNQMDQQKIKSILQKGQFVHTTIIPSMVWIKRWLRLRAISAKEPLLISLTAIPLFGPKNKGRVNSMYDPCDWRSGYEI